MCRRGTKGENKLEYRENDFKYPKWIFKQKGFKINNSKFTSLIITPVGREQIVTTICFATF